MKSTGLKITFAAAMLASVAMPAFADSPYGTLSGTLAVESDYRYRGISQNSKEFTPEGSINWTGPLGFYAGTWLAKTNWGAPNNDPSFEMDIYGGKHFDLGGTDLNVEAYYYSYPDFNAYGGHAASYFEIQSYLSHTFDKLTLTATGAYSPQWSLGLGDGWYGAGTASYALNDWLSVSSTIGHQWVQNIPGDGYTHWDVGFTATYKSFTFDVRYVGNSLTEGDCSTYWMSTHKACSDTVKANLTFNVADILK